MSQADPQHEQQKLQLLNAIKDFKKTEARHVQHAQAFHAAAQKLKIISNAGESDPQKVLAAAMEKLGNLTFLAAADDL